MDKREQELNDCLNKIFDYCAEHKETCTGCIFYREFSVGRFKSGRCKVMDVPDVFGGEEE